MSLEGRVADWIDLGRVDYADALDLQIKLIELRKSGEMSDVILTGEMNPIISFGRNNANNGFTEDFLENVRKKYGKSDMNAIKKYLHDLKIQFYDSTENTHMRGGGTAYTGPGQLVVYPIVNHKQITGDDLNVAKYNEIIDKIMTEVLQYYGIPALSVKVSTKLPVNDDERKERKDVWIMKEKPYKIGGKALRFSGGVASHGFSIYVTKESINHFNKILVCGYSQDQLGVTSMEHESGIDIDMKKVTAKTLEVIKEKFNYENISEVDLKEFIPLEGAV